MQVRNAIWANAGHTVVDCEVNHPQLGWVPFSAASYDTDPAGLALYSQIINDPELVIAPFVPPGLDMVKTAARVEVDEMAEAVRLRYITNGAGQSAVYQMKAEELSAYLLDPAPDPVNYPVVAAEATRVGETLEQRMLLIQAMRDFWLGKAAAIEAERIGGKKDIDDALDAAAVEAAKAASLTLLNAM